MRQEQDTIQKDQKKNRMELLEVKTVCIEIKCSVDRLNIRLGATGDGLHERKERPEDVTQNAGLRGEDIGRDVDVRMTGSFLRFQKWRE